MASSPDTESASSLDEVSIGSDGSHEEEKKKTSSAAEVKEQATIRLEIELSKAQQDLKLRDEEIAKLSRIRNAIEAEVQDLTASLFEEANNMVQNAEQSRAKAMKELKEANMRIEVLEAEVKALKQLISSSDSAPPGTPSRRQNGVRKPQTRESTPKKSPSNYELGESQFPLSVDHEIDLDIDLLSTSIGEVDPCFHSEFTEWKKNPELEKDKSSFLKRIYDEEIYPVFNFKNVNLMEMTLSAIEDNSIIVEAVTDKTPFPKRCALLDIPRICKYRLKLHDKWYNISELCRNRIIAVCDLFCYLRYIKEGLVKSGFHEIYWEVMRRRRNIALSRLGFPIC